MGIITKNNRSAGFTVLEMIISIIVVSLIVSSAVPFIQVQVDSYVQGLKAKLALQTVRIGMERAMSEIRNAKSPGTIHTASSTEFDFDNQDNDQIELSYGTFTVDGKSSQCLLYREVSFLSQEVPLLYDVSECAFSYLDAAGDPTWTKADVRVIRIKLKVQDSVTGEEFEIANQVAPTNF